jgi:hypothetical protein
VISHTAEGAYESGAEPEYPVVLNDAIASTNKRRSTATRAALRETNIQRCATAGAGPPLARGSVPELELQVFIESIADIDSPAGRVRPSPAGTGGHAYARY